MGANAISKDFYPAERNIKSDPVADGPTSNRSVAIWIASLLSLLPLAALIFILRDSPNSFRDVETLTDLLGMTFGALALPWLIATVLMQSGELSLQREELKLQRLEVRRLADETGRQARFMERQLQIEQRAAFVSEFRAFVGAETSRLKGLLDEMAQHVCERAAEKIGISVASATFKRFYATNYVRVVVSPSGGDPVEVRVRYSELVDRFGANTRLRRTRALRVRCVRAGLGRWFRRHLAYEIGPLSDISVYKLLLFTGVVARLR